MEVFSREQWARALPKPLRSRPRHYNRDGWVAHWPGPYSPLAKLGRWADELESYRHYHQDTKGWQFLAYNFAVDPDGGIWEGRGWNAENAANQGANATTYSVLFLGTGRLDTGNEVGPTVAALNSARWLIGQAPGNGQVRAHHQVSDTGTECPGRLIGAELASIRPDPYPEESPQMYERIVAAYIAGGRTPTPAEVHEWIVVLNGFTDREVLEHLAFITWKVGQG